MGCVRESSFRLTSFSSFFFVCTFWGFGFSHSLAVTLHPLPSGQARWDRSVETPLEGKTAVRLRSHLCDTIRSVVVR